MGSLFGKILLSFWVALVLMGVIIALSSVKMNERDHSSWKNLRDQFYRESKQGAEILRREGPREFKTWMQYNKPSSIRRVYLLDQQGKELFDQTLPAHFFKEIKQALRGTHDSNFTFDLSYYAQHVLTASGSPMILVSQVKLPQSLFLTMDRMVLGFIVSGIICCALTYYLTRPLQRLRDATRKVASGQLDFLVARAIGPAHGILTELGHEFDDMTARLQAMIQSQKQLILDISHELRSPLARLRVAVALAQKKLDDTHPVQTECARIELEAVRLNDLIEQMLLAAKSESHAITMSKQNVSMHTLIDTITKDVRFEAEQSRRWITVSCNDPATVPGDVQLLRSAIENVLRNAVKYTADNTGVTLCSRLDNDRLILTVRDHGPGVPDEMLETIFDPFVRVEFSRAKQTGGYGLGLTIARRIVHWHSGRIYAENAQDGLSVTMELPAAAALRAHIRNPDTGDGTTLPTRRKNGEACTNRSSG